MPKHAYRVKYTYPPSDRHPNGTKGTIQKGEETGADVEARKLAYNGATAQVGHVDPENGARTHLRTYSPAGISPDFDPTADSLAFYDENAFLTDEQLAQGATHKPSLDAVEAPEPQAAPVPRFRFEVVSRRSPQETPFFRTNSWSDALQHLEQDPERWMIRPWTPPTAHLAVARLVGGAGGRAKTFRAECGACDWKGPNRTRHSDAHHLDAAPHNDLPWEGYVPEPTPEYPPFEPLLKPAPVEKKPVTPTDVEGALRYLGARDFTVSEGDNFHEKPYVMISAADMAKILDHLPESTW